MMTAEQCRALVKEYKTRATSGNISPSHARLLTNIARTFTGLATQHDLLATHIKEATGGKSKVTWGRQLNRDLIKNQASIKE